MRNSKILLSNTTSKVGQTLIGGYKANLVLNLSYLLFRIIYATAFLHLQNYSILYLKG